MSTAADTAASPPASLDGELRNDEVVRRRVADDYDTRSGDAGEDG
jgi:hypothetical protein